MTVACVSESLGDRKICVVELNVLSDYAYRHLAVAGLDALYHCPPLREVRLRRRYPKLTAHDLREPCLLKHERCFVQTWYGPVFDNAVGLYIAEQCDFSEYALVPYRLIAAKYYDVRVYAHALKLLDGVLRGL